MNLYGVFTVKKKQGQVLFLENATMAIMGCMGIVVFTSALLRLVHLPLTKISMFILLLLSGCLLLFADKKLGKQDVLFRKRDLFYVLMLGLGICAYAYKYFTPNLCVHFISSDAGRHFSYAYRILTEGKTDLNMYYAAMNQSLAMMILEPFISGWGQIKVFVLMVLFDLFLAGLLIYALIARYIQTAKDYVAGVLLCGLYVLGYPLYAVQFGFVYFEAAVLIIAFIIFVARDYLEEASIVTLVLLNIELFALMVCYTYFVPAIYVSLFVAVFFHRKKEEKSLISIALEEIKVFLVPFCLGMYFSYANFGEISQNGNGGIRQDGGCYSDLFSNFIWLLPLVVLGCYILWKKQNYLLPSFLICNLLFTAVLFFFSLKKEVSIYYYFKEYNVLWLLMFLLFFAGFVSMKKETAVVGVVMLLIPVIAFLEFRMEPKLNEVSERYLNVSAGSFVNIYCFNYNIIKESYPMSDEVLAFFDVIKEQYGDGNCFAIGNEGEAAWFEAYTGEENSMVYGDEESLKKEIASEDYDYVCVMPSDLGQLCEEYLQSLGEVVYNCNAGYVIRINE